jgi:hypothetical protein
MHLKLLRAAATAAVFGGVVTLGLGSTQAALASPAPPTFVPCNASLSAAITAADPGAVLALAPGCTYWLTETGLPTISKTLTIEGRNSSITRSYANETPSFSIFSVSSGGDLTLDNVNVGNGDGDDDGGAISNVDSFVTINGGTFSDNHGVDGGAIYNDDGDGTLTINGATFKDNGASENGGAVYNVDGSTVTIHGGTFIDNDATEDGGAVYDSSGLTVDGAAFVHNGGYDGGAIYIGDYGATIDGSTLRQNSADEGGAVYNDGALTANGSTFGQNEGSAYGGGIYNAYKLTLNGGSFSQNDSEYGGAIANLETLTVTHTAMDMNTASAGGAVYNESGIDSAAINYSMITFNRADGEGDGGAIYDDSGTVDLTGDTIMYNTPDNCAPGTIAGCTG